MLDGQDRCMKDTLIEQLRKHLKTPRIQVFHEGKPPSGVDYRLWAIEHYSFMLRNAFSNHQGGVIIYNRSHLGEVVWGPKYRGYDADFIFELERLMARDDGKSLTKSTQELDEVRSMFSSALDRSCIQNKLHVKLEEVAFDDVFPTVWSFINAKSK
jgi:hypothetical protein